MSITYTATTDMKINLDWFPQKELNLKNPPCIAQCIMHDVPFARNEGRQLFFYKDGIYHSDGEQAAAEFYSKILTSRGFEKYWKSKTKNEVIDWLVDHAPLLLDRPPFDTINLINGLYDWQNQRIIPHTPDIYNTVRIPVIYDPYAQCPTWDKFLHDLFPVEGGDTYLRQFIGICMIPFTGLQKFIVLVGTGSNGKSTFLNAFQSFIGPDNVSNIPLDILTRRDDRFSREGIVGKLVNMFGDMTTKEIRDTMHLKAITGEDRILVERKFKQSYFYTPFARLIFGCNNTVEADDTSEGYLRRIIQIPFSQKFAVNPAAGKALLHELGRPSEMSGLFNKVVRTLPSVTEHGLTVTPAIAGAINEHITVPEEIRTWLAATFDADPNCLISMSRMYTFYIAKCPTTNFNQARFVSYVRGVFPYVIANVECTQDGRFVLAYKGIRAKDVIDQQRLISGQIYY